MNGDTLAWVFAPDTFTPNSDGMNDIFYPIVDGDIILSTYELKIFNYSNEDIFISENVNIGWDGSYLANRYETGNYLFTIKFTLFNGTELKFKGKVTLIR